MCRLAVITHQCIPHAPVQRSFRSLCCIPCEQQFQSTLDKIETKLLIAFFSGLTARDFLAYLSYQ